MKTMKVLLSACLIFFLFSTALQADEKLDVRVRKIAIELRCPTCQGLSIQESQAGLSENMKTKIRQLLEEGKSDQEVLDFFEQRYGEWILRTPKMSGFNWTLWLLPVGLLGIILLVLLKRTQRSSRKSSEQVEAPEQAPLSKKEQAIIEREMKKMERR